MCDTAGKFRGINNKKRIFSLHLPQSSLLARSTGLVLHDEGQQELLSSASFFDYAYDPRRKGR